MAEDEEDEILLTFYQDSKEQLDGFDKDLLVLSRDDVEFDEELANCIFRAIHVIKGGAGFFAIDKLRDLAQNMENLLDRIRRQECTLSSEIVNMLIDGGKIITQLIYQPERINEIDTSEINEKIVRVLESSMTLEEIEEAESGVDISLPEGKVIFTVKKYDFDRAFVDSDNACAKVYLIRYDLIKDIELKKKTPWEVISELLELCIFIDSKVDITGIGTLDTVGDTTAIPFYVLVSSIIEKDMLLHFLDIEAEQISLVSRSGCVLTEDEAEDMYADLERAEDDSLEWVEDEEADSIVSFEDFLTFNRTADKPLDKLLAETDKDLLAEFAAESERFVLLKQKYLYLDRNNPESVAMLVQIEAVLERLESIISKIRRK